MNRDVVIAAIVGLVIGLAAMYAAAPHLPGMVTTYTTTFTSTKLVPTTIYRTSTTTTTTTLERTRTVTLTATVTHTITRTVTQVQTKTVTATVTVTHIPQVTFELKYRSVSEGINGTQITTGSYGITTANGTWILFMRSETTDEHGNVIYSWSNAIEAKLSEDGKMLILTWEPSIPLKESTIVKVYLYSEDGRLLAKGSEIATPGATEVQIVLQWIEKGLPTRLVVEMTPVK